MASLLQVSCALFIFYSALISFSLTTITAVFSEELPQIVANRREKMSLLHFYFHDITRGKNRTVISIAGPANGKIGDFGSTVMIDDPLTIGPDRSSKVVGRAQGIYGRASQRESAMLMVMNLVFIEGKYNGSSIAIVGRNEPSLNIREMPIVGGSGLFRLARGYALAHTIQYNPNTGDAIVQYNVSVLHY